jgi:DNA (cytosine-5)-methyltransferase 1
MKTAIDLYSGIGGWTLGMKLSGISNLASFEWWDEANQTHNLNFNTDHKEVNIRDLDANKHLNFSKKIQFIVGSPPCTQFSFANKGGNGDIQDGLIDIAKFLEVVEHFKPKYWAMENVPRVAKILEKELNEGSLRRFRKLVTVITIVDSSDYGIPQSRKRMIAGNFPIELFESYKKTVTRRTLGDVISSLNKNIVIDPNYGYKIKKSLITELENECDLTDEEIRINRDSKTYHPVYNKMSFPDSLKKPSRTVTATCTRVSRESIIIKSETGYRRLNVRERGVIQGFPITYQFYGRSLNSKFKMIGNAVPPLLTYYIFQSMLETKLSDLKAPSASDYIHLKPNFKAFKSKLNLPVKKYPDKRKFQFAVPHLRYGSGVRFELSNVNKEKKIDWSFKFYYGNSKNIKEIELNNDLKKKLAPIVNTSHNEIFTECANRVYEQYKNIDSQALQQIWTSANSNMEVFNFLDNVGSSIDVILKEAMLDGIDTSLLESIIKEKNKKMNDNSPSIIAGFYFLSILNSKIFK